MVRLLRRYSKRVGQSAPSELFRLRTGKFRHSLSSNERNSDQCGSQSIIIQMERSDGPTIR